jgi:valyl-tRNA synthetase
MGTSVSPWWEEHGYFQPDPNATGEPFTITMPPPNVTGALHMGHAMFVTLQDIMARNARMRGRGLHSFPFPLNFS